MEYLHAVDEAHALGQRAGGAKRAGHYALEARLYEWAARIFRSVPPGVAGEARRAYNQGYREATSLPDLTAAA